MGEEQLIQCEMNRLESLSLHLRRSLPVLQSLPKGSKEKHEFVSSLLATSNGNQLSARTNAAILSQRPIGDDPSVSNWKSNSKISPSLPFASPPNNVESSFWVVARSN